MKAQFYIAILLLLFSCKKVEDRTCWKSQGEINNFERYLDEFNAIETKGSIEIHLVQDSLNFAVLKCGTHLEKQIQTRVEAKHLYIENHNRCSFVRPKQETPILELHYIFLDTIHHAASESLKTINCIKTNHLVLKSLDNSSHLDLEVDVKDLIFHTSDSWTDLTVKGKVDQLTFYLKGNSFSDAKKLEIKEATVISKSAGNIELGTILNKLKVDIRGSGNIYYSGNPATIEKTDTGDGELIHL